MLKIKLSSNSNTDFSILANLSSQIFANIYLNEFDRFVRHRLKPQAYLRYGDDFILMDNSRENLEKFRILSHEFLFKFLKLTIKNTEVIIKAKQGLKFLGMRIDAEAILLLKRNGKRVIHRLNEKNLPSYFGLVKSFGDREFRKI